MENVFTFVCILLANLTSELNFRKSGLKYSGPWKEHFSFLEVAHIIFFLKATRACHQGRHFYNLNIDDENKNRQEGPSN